MDSTYGVLFGALRRMESLLCMVLEGRCAEPVEEPVFNNEYADDTIFDDFDSGPVFDTDPDDFDYCPVFDSNFDYTDDLSEVPIFDTYTNDLGEGPVFDSEPNTDHVTVAMFEFAKSEYVAELAVFHEEPEHEEEALTTDKEFFLSTNITATTATIDAPFTCSRKFMYLDDAEETLVTESLQVFTGVKEARGLNSRCRVLHTSCFGNGSRGWREELFHEGLELFILVQGDTTVPVEALRSVIYDRVATGVFEHKFWDPGSSEGSEFSRFRVDVDSAHHNELCIDEFESKFWDPGLANWSEFMELGRSHADFLWDPGLYEGLLSIQFIRHSADFNTAHHHEFHPVQFEYRFWDPGLAEASKLIVIARSCAEVCPDYFHGLIPCLSSQQKCGGCHDGTLACQMLHYAQLPFVDRKFFIVGCCLSNVVIWDVAIACTVSMKSDDLASVVDIMLLIAKSLLHRSYKSKTWKFSFSDKLTQTANFYVETGDRLFLLKDLNFQVFACAQLLLSVSYWYPETVSLWGYHWKTDWTPCAAEMLKPWDPQISEFSLGGIMILAICYVTTSGTGQGTKGDQDQTTIRSLAELASCQENMRVRVLVVPNRRHNVDSDWIYNSYVKLRQCYFSLPQAVRLVAHKLSGLSTLYKSLFVQMGHRAQWLCLILLQWITHWWAIPTAEISERHSLHVSEVPGQSCVYLPDAAFSEGTVVIQGILLQPEAGVLIPIGYLTQEDVQFSQSLLIDQRFLHSPTSDLDGVTISGGACTREVIIQLAMAAVTVPNSAMKDELLSYKSRIWVRIDEVLQIKVVSALLSSSLGNYSGFPINCSRINHIIVWEGRKGVVHDFLIGMVCPQPLVKACKPHIPNYESLLVCDDGRSNVEISRDYFLEWSGTCRIHGSGASLVSLAALTILGKAVPHFSFNQGWLRYSTGICIGLHPRLQNRLSTTCPSSAMGDPSGTNTCSRKLLNEFWYILSLHVAIGRSPIDGRYEYFPRQFTITDQSCSMEKCVQHILRAQDATTHSPSFAEQYNCSENHSAQPKWLDAPIPTNANDASTCRELSADNTREYFQFWLNCSSVEELIVGFDQETAAAAMAQMIQDATQQKCDVEKWSEAVMLRYHLQKGRRRS